MLLHKRTVLSRYSDSLRTGRSGDRIPVGARFSAPVQTGSEAHPTSYTMGTGSFPGVKRSGRGVDHPLLSNAEVEERIELHLYSPSGPSWPVLGRPLSLPLPFTAVIYYRIFVTTYRSYLQESGNPRKTFTTYLIVV